MHLHTGTYFHYLHHNTLNVIIVTPSNYLDKWFGTMHDGSDESHQKIKLKIKLDLSIYPSGLTMIHSL